MSSTPDWKSLLEGARQQWPELEVPLAVFASYLEERLTSEELAALAGDRAQELYLACACVSGVSGASEAFVRSFDGSITSALARMESNPAALGEAKQQLLVELLVGSERSRPKLAEYAGRGPLGAWLRVVATRVVLRMKKVAARWETLPERIAARSPTGALEPELDLLRQQYAAELRACFGQALETLGSESRMLLRMHYLEGLTGAQLSAVLGISRATLNRRLAAARQSVLEDALRRLEKQLGLGSNEVQDVLRALRSVIELSVARLLRESSPG